MGFHPVYPGFHVGEVVRRQLVPQRLHYGPYAVRRVPRRLRIHGRKIRPSAHASPARLPAIPSAASATASPISAASLALPNLPPRP